MQFDTLLARADDETLQALIGAPALRLMWLLDPALVTPATLRDVATRLHGRQGLLAKDDKRRRLFDQIGRAHV